MTIFTLLIRFRIILLWGQIQYLCLISGICFADRAISIAAHAKMYFSIDTKYVLENRSQRLQSRNSLLSLEIFFPDRANIIGIFNLVFIYQSNSCLLAGVSFIGSSSPAGVTFLSWDSLSVPLTHVLDIKIEVVSCIDSKLEIVVYMGLAYWRREVVLYIGLIHPKRSCVLYAAQCQGRSRVMYWKRRQ